MPYATKEQRSQYWRERYQYLKSLKICVTCGKESAAIGFASCGRCLERNQNKYHGNNEAKQRKQAKAKERSARLQAEGLCVVCGSERDGKSVRYCEKCRLKHLRCERRRRAEKKVYCTEEELCKVRLENLKKAHVAALTHINSLENKKAFGERVRRIKNWLFKKKRNGGE